MDFFLIMIAPILIVILCIAGLFWWGAKRQEPYKK
ncbi:cytochrome bd oxidase small subunit CydS [Alkalihalophilus marmarensis]